MKKIIFMGTPEFSVPALRALTASNYNVIAVYTQPPRPKGRGQLLQKSPVHLCADEHHIPVFHPERFKNNPEAIKQFQSLNADIAIVAAYGLILPLDILNAPRLGCLNIHASLLPRWRGASPIQRAIWAGDTKTGITIMQMEEGLDTGPMLLKSSFDLTLQTTATTLHDHLSALGGALILQALNTLETIVPERQDDSLSTYAKLLSRDDGAINWSDSAQAIDCQIRALNPWPGTFTTTSKGRLKILRAHVSPPVHALCGSLLDREGIVACGNNTALKLQLVQPDNAKAMDISSAINGGYLKVGDILS